MKSLKIVGLKLLKVFVMIQTSNGAGAANAILNIFKWSDMDWLTMILLVVGVDACADAGVGGGPLPVHDVDVVAHQPDRRAVVPEGALQGAIYV